ncbi:hypothetical protein [Oceanisphaera pacifica]|uniref:Riboflavin biosynthesis protein RibA n=1 Tax=Oceanisphaera pacifica TaxID=2818389 RepID=A0ABS3NDC4_9GAMM|nr:hypothetical protein [Oceanisphaera pacifica]MBO1518589.1 hypothetical protein [Oceanisphaera pacifica]
MSEQDVLIGEQFPHKVSATYNRQSDAEQAVKSLVDNTNIPREQIKLVHPKDPQIARKLEPEVEGVRRTFVKSHLVFGGIGFIVGIIVATLLITIGPAITRSSPVFTYIAILFLFTLIPLLAAGLISFRPDQDPLINKTREAAQSAQWTLVAHCADQEQQEQATRIITPTAKTL